MTEYEKLKKHIAEFKGKLAECKDANLICFYRNAIQGMEKKLGSLSIAQAERKDETK